MTTSNPGDKNVLCLLLSLHLGEAHNQPELRSKGLFFVTPRPKAHRVGGALRSVTRMAHIQRPFWGLIAFRLGTAKPLCGWQAFLGSCDVMICHKKHPGLVFISIPGTQFLNAWNSLSDKIQESSLHHGLVVCHWFLKTLPALKVKGISFSSPECLFMR